MLHSFVKFGLPVVGLTGGGYMYYRHDQKQQFLKYKKEFVNGDRYEQVKSLWNANRGHVSEAKQGLEKSGLEQRNLMMQIEPLQRQLSQHKQNEQEFNKALGHYTQQNQKLKTELHDVKKWEQQWVLDQRKLVLAAGEQQLQELNKIAHSAYQEKCAENSRLVNEGVIMELAEKEKGWHRADSLLSQMSE